MSNKLRQLRPAEDKIQALYDISRDRQEGGKKGNTLNHKTIKILQNIAFYI